MKFRVEGRTGRAVEVIIDELVVDREVAADPVRLQAALERELSRRLSAGAAPPELVGRSGELGRLVAGEVAAHLRSGPRGMAAPPGSAAGAAAPPGGDR
jgi:hypothetical protein